MNTLGGLQSFAANLKSRRNRLPVVFVGHGSPMNGIEDNEFSANWESIGRTLPRPEAVLVNLCALVKERNIHIFRRKAKDDL